MKFIFVDTYYPGYLSSFRKKYPNLEGKSYNEQKRVLLDQCFGTADYYSHNLKSLGHIAEDIVVNDEILQRQWAKESGLVIEEYLPLSKLKTLPFAYRFLGRPKWLKQIAIEQIKKASPDVVYVQDLAFFDAENLKKIKKHCRILVGQIAAPKPSQKNIKSFDLILSSFPHYVDKFRKLGVVSEYFRIGFESSLFARVGKSKRIYSVSFIGSFSPYHRKGTMILEQVAKEIPIDVWGQGINYLAPWSPLRKNYHGQAWGLDMYKIMSQSRIVLNRHIDVAGNFANNMRLYEATGMGALLLTEEKKNLPELFDLGREVVAYKNSIDLLYKIKYYLKSEKERKKIAQEGQKRTLSDHTYRKRMKELVAIVKKYL